MRTHPALSGLSSPAFTFRYLRPLQMHGIGLTSLQGNANMPGNCSMCALRTGFLDLPSSSTVAPGAAASASSPLAAPASAPIRIWTRGWFISEQVHLGEACQAFPPSTHLLLSLVRSRLLLRPLSDLPRCLRGLRLRLRLRAPPLKRNNGSSVTIVAVPPVGIHNLIGPQ